MASSDDDKETHPDVVSDYYFYDEEDEPVPFTEVPVQWSNGELSDDNKNKKIYLRGKIDNGLQRVHKKVKAWKFEFLNENPELSVLSKDNIWIKLQTPRKSYEKCIRTILITVHCLHFLWRKPEASSRALRGHLCEVFSLYDIRPSENDLKDHLNFIREAIKRDKTLQKSKFLASLLEGRYRKMRVFDQSSEAFMKPSFIVDDTVFEYEDYDDEHDDNDNVEYDIFDTVCAICDNGGDLTCCEGKCLRSFHATVKSATSAKSKCRSLGLHAEEVKKSQPFVCLNCFHEQHQCFVCGKLGSSNKSFAEVFCCSSVTCGHFYHPDCVAMLLEDESDTKAHNLEEKIASGEPFTCPAHRCHKCKKGEDDKVKGLQFAVCRRCPRSYHRKCLPSKIVFYNQNNDEEVISRAWNDLLPKSRALIYCLKHKMDQELGTAVRNIKFPEISESWKNNMTVEEEVVNSADYTSDEKSVEKPVPSVRPVDSSIKRAEAFFGSERVKKQRVSVTYKKPLKTNLSIDADKDHIGVDVDEQTPMVVENDNFFSLESNSRDRVKGLMKDCDSHMTVDKAKRRYSEKDYNKTRKPDVIGQQRYNEECKETKRYGNSSLSRRTRYSGVSSARYHVAVAEPSSCNSRSSTLAMNRYIPRLDELNHIWMKNNREMEVYDHPFGPQMDDSSFDDPGTYHPFPRRNQHRHLPRQYSYSHRNPHHRLRHRNPHYTFSHDSYWMWK